MRIISTTAVLLAAASAASADTINLQYLGPGAGQAFQVQAYGTSASAFAGQYRFIASGGTGKAASLNGSLVSFCLDVLEGVGGGPQSYDLKALTDAPVTSATSPMSDDQAAAIARIYTFAAGQQFGSSNDYAAAFNLAIWEIVADFDTSLDVGTGVFQVTQSIGTGVTDILDDLFAAAIDTSINGATLAALTNDGFQDQVVVIPLPGSAGLAAAGLLGLGVASRRRRA